jgi:SAM-dependent methyltransferase
MDELTAFNKARWEALAAANVEYSRPLLALDAESARREVDPFGVMDAVAGRDVLCLASGGGQQSAAFALLGAQVTVLDFSETQLERDRQALAHYGRSARLIQGDMRDLSVFADAAFDLVWHAFSINFVPDPTPVFAEVARVLRPGGQYRVQWHNPFVAAVDDRSWDGQGYRVGAVYADAEIRLDDMRWDIQAEDGSVQRVEGPREFNHTLSKVINGLIQRRFTIQGIWEAPNGDPTAEPGSWPHFVAVMPPWLTLWTRYLPDPK